MKLLMLITELGYGGAESAFVRLATELAKRHTVEIVVFKENYAAGDYTPMELPASLPINRLDSPDHEGLIGRWGRRLRGLRKLKTTFGADATISFLTGPNLLNVMSGGPGKTLVSIRGSRRHDAHAGPVAKWVHRTLVDPIVARLADAIVCVSEGLRLEMAGGSRRYRHKFHAISGYVDPARLAEAARGPVEPWLEPLSSLPVIVAAGRLSPEKGFQHLIRVFSRVRDSVRDAKLLLIGDGPFRGDLERACHDHGLTHGQDASADVILLGYRPDPSRYFRLGRVFVLPSASEGFPNILVEALAASVPVAAADVPWGTREVLGIAADPDNRPFPRAEPLETEYGTLLPRIDDPRFERAWIDALSAQLARGPEQSGNADRMRSRVLQLDCKSAAAKWHELLERGD